MLRGPPAVGGGFPPGRPGRPIEGIRHGPGIDASLGPISLILLVASVVSSVGRLVSLVGDLVSLVGGSVPLVTGLVPPITGAISAVGGLVPTVASLVARRAGPIPLQSRQTADPVADGLARGIR